MPFARKADTEWLDEDRGSPGEVRSALRSLRFVNRWFGGDRVHRLLLREAAGDRRELTVLEVAAGRATALASASLALARQGITVRATLLDRQASHLPPEWPAALPRPELLQGDALRIPLDDRSVDVVSCCLFLHHLAPEQAATFIAEAARVARVAVVVNDTERTRVHYGLARLFSLVDPSRLSRHDGPISVRQSYAKSELQLMLAATGYPSIVRRRYLYRMAGLLLIEPLPTAPE